MKTSYLGFTPPDWSDLWAIAEGKLPIELSKEAKERIVHGRSYLEKKIDEGGIYYGINTGFGQLCDVSIASSEMEMLQANLLRSHACGVGDEVPADIVRLMLVLKIQSLLYGYSGVCLETAERLLFFYNQDILPIVYDTGSLGASGDLAPLSHLCLPLMGEGEVRYKGEKMPVQAVHTSLGISPIKLKAKEGLALINGTQFMLAYGIYILGCADKLYAAINRTAAFSADVWLCRQEAFYPQMHKIRLHHGQNEVAAAMIRFLQDSSLHSIPKTQVQDPYSFRCIPQVHGASADTMDYVKKIFRNEMGSVTDNPLLFPEDDLILSGGNFHGQPLALALDFLAIALAELGSISERRTYLLLSGKRGLPPFLAKDPGINSGLMIAQYTAAALVSKNKQFCTPASVDSIISSNGQEDHVSMGANAAIKCFEIYKNLVQIMTIELACALQAYYLRSPYTTSPLLEAWISPLKKQITPLERDRFMQADFKAIAGFLGSSVGYES